MSIGDHVLVRRFRYYGRRLNAWARRVTPVGLAVRVVVWVTGLTALVIAAAPVVNPVGGLVLAMVLASLATGWPGTAWVSLLEFGAVAMLVVAVGQGAASLVEVGLVAALLYLHHTTAALAAQVRTDTLLSGVVLRHWLARAGAVLGVSVVVGAGIVALPVTQPDWSPSAYLVMGVLAAAATAAGLAYLLLRRPESA
jgi:hypothetical protein